ncbi:alpha/beta hydrolase [Halobacillus sp. ACCC02827]|uniref:alpha/beta fold hydrolase n=1 Tax=Halobacillus sp. ACCC02827 TaxID=3052090 RepID=UPI00256FC365|nr:alpha/beta hydrolase [Halobacillus sp. ACCC02827]WJE15158.1 alpha/beta hydrolase [Halobacillus sp. ACCC02827]
MDGNFRKVRGTHLYVERYGSDDKVPVLYLHGGPGESCFDFTYHQKARLSDDLHIIALDQRGVCRSEKIGEDDLFGLTDIIEDCEALRSSFHIEKWSVIGHSFGGYLALMYAHLYPDSIDKLIFECPTFDFARTSRSLLRKTAAIARTIGEESLAQRCVSFSKNESLSPRELTEGYMKLSDELGEDRVKIYQFSFDHPTDYGSAYSEEEWEEFYDKSEIHYDRLLSEGGIFQSQLQHLKYVEKPMLLMTAEHDAAVCEEQVEAFKETDGDIYHFEECGHTPHQEKPDLFSEVVKGFLIR